MRVFLKLAFVSTGHSEAYCFMGEAWGLGWKCTQHGNRIPSLVEDWCRENPGGNLCFLKLAETESMGMSWTQPGSGTKLGILPNRLIYPLDPLGKQPITT